MNELFAYKVEKFGAPANAEPFDAAAALQWRNKLPNGLLELWQEYGIGMWANGKFQFCRPDRYDSIVETIFQGDHQFQPSRTHLFGFGAFGDLLLWNEDLQNIAISLPYLRGSADVSEPDFKAYDQNVAISSTLTRIEADTSLTLFENTSSAPPIFNKCRRRFGELEPGECYGLFPALALGGSTDINSVKRVKALEHFSILAQLGPVRLVDYSGGSTRYIRNLGAQG